MTFYHCQSYSIDATADIVTYLPGMSSSHENFKQFSGYLKVSGSKKIHYWFIESSNSPENAPLAFWMNGGPGCSGLIGLLQEHGPYRVLDADTLSFNPYSWNSVANMVYLESPCGTGFSISSSIDDYVTDDTQTALDNYNTIQSFFTRFPEYSANDIYISSESYGAHFIPQLAKLIVDSNSAGASPTLNLKGFTLGNPYVEASSGFESMMETLWGHQLIAKPYWDVYKKSCTSAFNNNSPTNTNGPPQDESCSGIIGKILDRIGGRSPYALDFPVCTSDPDMTNKQFALAWFAEYIRDRQTISTSNGKVRTVTNNAQTSYMSSVNGDMRFKSSVRKSIATISYDPCREDFITKYLNKPEVKEALHVDKKIIWRTCSSVLNYNITDIQISMKPLYEYLFKSTNLKVLIYSGDNDAVCPTIGTQQWLWNMDILATNADAVWSPYTSSAHSSIPEGQIISFLKKKIIFMTINGAGHEAAAYKPITALSMWQKFLNGTLAK